MQPREENSDICGEITFPKELPSFIDVANIENKKNEWVQVGLTSIEAIDLEQLTRSQTESPLWFAERSKRITASNFGRVMTRKKDVNDAFLGSFQRQSFTSAPTSYGKANEVIAKQMYIKQTGNHIHDIGLVVNPDLPFLGASPDAIVCDNMVTGLVEIKCPYSVRDMTIEDACVNSKTFFLQNDGENYKLSQKHVYWYQVQGQLLVTGAQFCDFVTYTKQDLYIERILPHEETMITLIEKLTSFYINHLKPYLAKSNVNAS